MRISIYSINNTLFDGEVEKIIARTTSGEITVLDGHLPIVTLLNGPGLELEVKGERKTIPIKSGVLEVRPEKEAIVLTN